MVTQVHGREVVDRAIREAAAELSAGVEADVLVSNAGCGDCRARGRLRAAADRRPGPAPWPPFTPAGAEPLRVQPWPRSTRWPASSAPARKTRRRDRPEHRRLLLRGRTELVDAFAAAGHARHLIDRWFLASAAAAGSAAPAASRAAGAAARRRRRQSRSADPGRRARRRHPRRRAVHGDAPRRADVVPDGEGKAGRLAGVIRRG